MVLIDIPIPRNCGDCPFVMPDLDDLEEGTPSCILTKKYLSIFDCLKTSVRPRECPLRENDYE